MNKYLKNKEDGDPPSSLQTRAIITPRDEIEDKLREMEAVYSPSVSIPDDCSSAEEINREEKTAETVEKRIKLSGAGRKRFIWLIKHGHDPSDARKLALKSIPERKETKLKVDSARNPSKSSGENKEAQPQDKIAPRVKLSGAGRRRYKRLLEEGVDPEEARKIALKRINENEKNLKIIVSKDSTTDHAFRKYSGHASISSLSVDVQPEETNTQTKEKHVRLSGAGKKRYKWLVQHGHNPEDAHKLAQTHIGDRFTNSAYNENSITEHSLPKRARTETNVIELKKQEQSFGDNIPMSSPYPQPVNERIRMVICSTNYPESLLTTDQLKDVQDCILKKIMEHKDESIKPKFHGSSFKPGWLVLICGDIATAEWLKAITVELEPWNGALLKVVKESEFGRQQIFVIHFPNSTDDSNNKILEYLKAQNKDINLAALKILRRSEVGTSAQLILSVEHSTVAKLKDREYKLNYKFGQVKLKPKKGPHKEQGTARPQESAPWIEEGSLWRLPRTSISDNTHWFTENKHNPQNLQLNQQRQFSPPLNRRREFSPPLNRRREFSPPPPPSFTENIHNPMYQNIQLNQQRDLSPQVNRRRELSPPLNRPQDFSTLVNLGLNQQRDLSPPMNRRREFSPQLNNPQDFSTVVNLRLNQQRDLSPAMNRRREFSPPLNRRREFSPPLNRRREFSPPLSRPQDFSTVVNRRRELSPPMRRQYEHSQSMKRLHEDSPPMNRCYEHSPPGNRQRELSLSAEYMPRTATVISTEEQYQINAGLNWDPTSVLRSNNDPSTYWLPANQAPPSLSSYFRRA